MHDNEPLVLSVSELNQEIKALLEGSFDLIWVRGEISNFKAHTSGHFYFSLKDKNSQISAVMFRGANLHLRFRPEDGMEVLTRGRISVYEPRGNYQIICEVIEPLGTGALQKAFEQLKNKLQKEGLFAESRKRSIPSLPQHIAIVTSPTGAAISDMLNVLNRRFKGLKITLIPTLVQGDEAPAQIIRALQKASQLPDVDVLIVGRGGGSIEDLWCFNNEGVARAIANSPIPVISAVGHEVDFTIADFVADLRAPTPSAAAELVVQNREEILEQIKQNEKTLRLLINRKIDLEKKQLSLLLKGLIDPRKKVQDLILKCDDLSERLQLATKRYFETLHLKLESSMALLDSLSPLKVIERGYSITQKGHKIIKSIHKINPGDELSIIVHDGLIHTSVTGTEKGDDKWILKKN